MSGRRRWHRSLLALAAIAIAGAAAPTAGAQTNWPERPIRLIVPFTPGSSSDTIGRIVAQRLGERLGQPLVVENRVGASGNLGAEVVARAEPDGYTLGLANTSTHAVAVSLAAHLNYDPARDFVPVAMLGNSPFVLALHTGLPAHSVRELIEIAKEQPRGLTYASAGPATLAHLAAALFETMAQIEFTHIPYRGTAQSTLDVVEGRVNMQFGTIPPALPLIRAGQLRALGVTSAARNAALPEVPTIAESGLPGYETLLWQGIVAPAATPPAVVAELNREIRAILAEPATQTAFNQQGVEADPGPPEAFAARIRDDIKKWHDVIVRTGLR